VQEERYGTRDLTYSVWHRSHSTKRFVGYDRAHLLSMIDLDGTIWIEYGHSKGARAPVALIETARDVGQPYKPVTVLVELAKLSGLLALVVLYTHSDRVNPADDRYSDIARFRVKRAWPNPETVFSEYTPQQWAERLLQIRQQAADDFDRRAQRSGLFGT
jgi:hypothetical protein